ncbi:hypothetical protein ACFSKV_11990 [Shivajiella indica]|uniref:Uncharacterized protein n=1 Tax=Shivajiella indica TaxID=872115 RepID=A0ABW5BBT9_9BACT
MVSSYGNHSYQSIFQLQPSVVNCFQNGIFLWESQPRGISWAMQRSCELLSKWYLPMGITAMVNGLILRSGCELLSKWYLPMGITAI